MERINDIKVTLQIFNNGELVNTLTETGANAWFRLATVLVQQNNDPKSCKVWGSINGVTGLQIIKAKSYEKKYIYEYLFSGLACEDLPRV